MTMKTLLLVLALSLTSVVQSQNGVGDCDQTEITTYVTGTLTASNPSCSGALGTVSHGSPVFNSDVSVRSGALNLLCTPSCVCTYADWLQDNCNAENEANTIRDWCVPTGIDTAGQDWCYYATPPESPPQNIVDFCSSDQRSVCSPIEPTEPAATSVINTDNPVSMPQDTVGDCDQTEITDYIVRTLAPNNPNCSIALGTIFHDSPIFNDDVAIRSGALEMLCTTSCGCTYADWLEDNCNSEDAANTVRRWCISTGDSSPGQDWCYFDTQPESTPSITEQCAGNRMGVCGSSSGRPNDAVITISLTASTMFLLAIMVAHII